MKYKKFKKLLSFFLTYLILFNTILSSIVTIETVHWDYVEWTYNTITSSGLTFTGKSFFNSINNNYTNTWNLSFDFDFGNSFSWADFMVDYNWTQSWTKRLYDWMSWSWVGPYYLDWTYTAFSWIIYKSTWDWFFTWANISIFPTQEWFYNLKVEAFDSWTTILDSLNYNFTIDRTPLVINNTWTFLNITDSWAYLNNVLIWDSIFSWAVLRFWTWANYDNQINMTWALISVNYQLWAQLVWLLSWTTYNAKIEAYDKAWNISTATWLTFTTLTWPAINWMCWPADTASVGFNNTGSMMPWSFCSAWTLSWMILSWWIRTWSCVGINWWATINSCDAPYMDTATAWWTAGSLMMYFDNNWQTSSWWTVRATANTLSTSSANNISYVWISVNNSFGISSGTTIDSFSWDLSSNSCSTTFLDTTSKPWETIIKCKLNNTGSITSSWFFSFNINWLTNPINPGKYYFNMGLSKDWINSVLNYWWDFFFKDFNDNINPSVSFIWPVRPDKFIIDFNEPIFTIPNISIVFTWWTSPGFNWFYRDDSFPNRLYINTDNQSPLSYIISYFSWITDYNNNPANAWTWFTWMGTGSMYIDYVSPFNLNLWNNWVVLDIYWQNNIFSWSVTALNFWTWITQTWAIITIDSNHIQVKVDIATNTKYGGRDLSLTANWQNYFLPSAFRVDKSWTTVVNMMANINPMNNTSWEVSDYYISFPVWSPLYPWDKIELTFPWDFNISNVSFDSGAMINYSGASLDAAWNVTNTTTPKFDVSHSVTSWNKLTLTILPWYQALSNEMFNAKISWITNPAISQSYTINLETRQKLGSLLNSFQSTPIFIKDQWIPKAITYKLVTSTWVAIALSWAMIKGNWPEGNFTLYTNSSWEIVYTWSQWNYYSVFFDVYPKIWNWASLTENTNYVYDSQFLSTYLDDDKTVKIILKWLWELTTIGWNINWLNWKNVTLWVSWNWSYFENDLWILNSNTYSYSIKVPKNAGKVMVWIRPTISKDYINNPLTTAYQTWQPPKPKEVEVWTGTVTWMDFNVIQPSIDFTIITQSTAWSPIANAHIYVYSPSWDMMWLYWDTDLNWQIKFKVLPWTYNYWAYIEGMPSPTEQSINISNLSVSNTGTLNVLISSQSIAWQITVNGNPVSKASVSAFETTKNIYRYTTTDTNGNYKLYAENWNWQISWWVPNYWPLDQTWVTLISTDIQKTVNFDITNASLNTITWSVLLSWWDKVIWANIMAEGMGTGTMWGYAFTDNNGNYSLLLKDWDYKLRAFHGDYWEIGTRNITINWSWTGWQDFTVMPIKSLTVSFTWAWIPQDLTKFEWMIDAFDNTNSKWFNQAIRSLTWYTFSRVWSWVYSIKVNVTWFGTVFSSWSFDINSDSNIQIELAWANKMVPVSWVVSFSWSTEQPKDVFVELRDVTNNRILWTKTNSWWIFNFQIWANINYELIAKKPWYKTTDFLTGNTSTSWNSWINIILEPISGTTYTIGGLAYSWSVNSSNILDGQKAFISFQWVNDNWTENAKWYWKEVYLSWWQFNLDWIPADISKWKIIIAIDWFEIYKDPARTLSNISNLIVVLTPLTSVAKPLITTITPSQWWVITDTSVRFKVILPSSALGNGTEAWQVITKETSAIPSTPWSEPIGWKAKEIKATDSNGNAINSLTQEATIELTYSGSELVNANTGITINDVKNLAVYYYDQSAQSWIAMPTIVTSSSGTILDLTWTTLLSSIGNTALNETTFTLKAKTDHFTLFTSLISTSIKNSTSWWGGWWSWWWGGGWSGWGGWSSGWNSSWWWGGWGWWTTVQASITTWIGVTVNSVSKYLGNIEQTIVLKHWSNISEILTITRNGKTVNLSDIVTNSNKTVTNLWKNLVTFAVWDIISASGKWWFELSLGWYSKVNLSANSSIKISEVGNNFLTFENIKGTSTYQFDKKWNWFQYKIRWKVGYATIRWTTLSVTSTTTSDTYNLIEWKIDIYNSKLNKTVSLTTWSKYIAYTNWKDELVTPNTKQNIPTKKITSCTPYKDLELGTIACTYITKLKNNGIVKSSSYFEPNKSITRAELLSMIMKSAKISVKYDPNFTFSDIRSTDWWASYVSTAKKLNMINPNNPNFEPNRPITRAEALTIIMKFKWIALSYNSKYTYLDIKSSDWWGSAVSTAKSKGYISATNKNFNPLSKISRQESAIILFNAFFK